MSYRSAREEHSAVQYEAFQCHLKPGRQDLQGIAQRTSPEEEDVLGLRVGPKEGLGAMPSEYLLRALKVRGCR